MAVSQKQTQVSVSSVTTAEAESYFNAFLEQQKSDFESNNPLGNTEISKLSPQDDAVLIFLSNTQVDNLKFNGFSYEVSDINVYNENGKIYADAYIIRNLNFGPDQVTTGLGDEITIEIPNSESPQASATFKNGLSNTEKTISLEEISYENHNEIDTKIDVNKFLKAYKTEVEKSKKLEQEEKNKLKRSLHQGASSQPTLTGEDSRIIAMAATSPYYNRAAAVDYARKYAIKPNPSYTYYTNADCTNFVSQALRAGRIPEYPKWKPYTDAFINAGSFRDYIREEGGIKMRTSSDTYTNASLGDVYHYDTRNKAFLPFPDDWMEHTAIVTKKANSSIYVSYHSTNRLDVKREYYTSVEGGNRFLSEILH